MSSTIVNSNEVGKVCYLQIKIYSSKLQDHSNPYLNECTVKTTYLLSSLVKSIVLGQNNQLYNFMTATHAKRVGKGVNNYSESGLMEIKQLFAGGQMN